MNDNYEMNTKLKDILLFCMNDSEEKRWICGSYHSLGRSCYLYVNLTHFNDTFAIMIF